MASSCVVGPDAGSMHLVPSTPPHIMAIVVAWSYMATTSFKLALRASDCQCKRHCGAATLGAPVDQAVRVSRPFREFACSCASRRVEAGKEGL